MFNFGMSSGESSSKPVQLSMYAPEQQGIFSSLGSLISQGLMSRIPAYPRKLFVPKQKEEQTYFDVNNMVANNTGDRFAALKTVLSGKPAYDINPEITKQYFANAIRPLMAREFYGTTMPAIGQSYAGPGYWSSARALSEANATERFAENLSATEANLVYADEMARRASLESAATRQAQTALPSVEAAVSDLGTAGEYARTIEQERILSDYQRWLSGETIDGVKPVQYNPFLQLAFQYLGQQPYTYGQESSSSQTGFNFGLKL